MRPPRETRARTGELPAPRRSNAAWLAALRNGSEDGGAAARELEVYLRRTLARVARPSLGDGDLTELVQESLLRVLESLDSFRGDSAFTTWATAVAIRVAFTELRRRRTRRQPHAFEAVRREVDDLPHPASPPPETALSRQDVLGALQHAIATSLTPRQRLAITAELRGIPTVRIAAELDTNQNALYKLVHDARRKLRSALLARGFTAESIHDVVVEGAR